MPHSTSGPLCHTTPRAMHSSSHLTLELLHTKATENDLTPSAPSWLTIFALYFSFPCIFNPTCETFLLLFIQSIFVTIYPHVFSFFSNVILSWVSDRSETSKCGVVWNCKSLFLVCLIKIASALISTQLNSRKGEGWAAKLAKGTENICRGTEENAAAKRRVNSALLIMTSKARGGVAEHEEREASHLPRAWQPWHPGTSPSTSRAGPAAPSAVPAAASGPTQPQGPSTWT